VCAWADCHDLYASVTYDLYASTGRDVSTADRACIILMRPSRVILRSETLTPSS